MGLKLFEESDDGEDISKIEINKDFARRFEHNKKREELQRFEELKKKGLIPDSDESSEESDDEEEDLEKGDLILYDALLKIQKNDPIINQKEVKFFNSDEEDELSHDKKAGNDRRKKKDKPLYLKDVLAKQIMEEGPEFEENQSKSHLKSYSEEQDEIRKAFLDAAEEDFDGDDEDFLKVKEPSKGNEEVNTEIQKKLDQYFGNDGNLDDNELFLKNFCANKLWVDKDKGKRPSTEELAEVSNEEDELDREDEYEAQYNFRFEEGVGDRVLGHARNPEGSVRKKVNTRKSQRQRKEERMSQKKSDMEEELKHLKNLKMKEIMNKLQKIQAVAGIKEARACAFNEDDLEEDFDPEEYDKRMKKTFNEDYYEAGDVDPGFGSGNDDDGGDFEKPDFAKEDELLGLSRGWDEYGSSDGFLAAREKVLQCKGEKVSAKLPDEEGQEEDKHESGRRKRKHKISLQEKVALEKELEEYYKLDYEDAIGDLKTRFKYTAVPPNRYGFSSDEILLIDDTNLNQLVSLKKLAPYRQEEWKISKEKRYHMRKTKKLLLQGLKEQKVGRKKKLQSSTSKPDKTQLENVNGDVPSNGEVGTSRRSKRRRRQAELKLSQSRLKAYGNLHPMAKIQEKN